MSECGTHQNCTGAHRLVPAALCETLIPRVVLYFIGGLYLDFLRWGIAAGTATGAALGTKSNAKAERKCQNFALVTTLFSGSASPRRVGRGSSQYLLPSSPVATHFPALSATMPRGGGSNTARRRYAALVRCMRLAVVLCYNFVSNSAWLYPLTPLVIMPRKSSREKSESRNTSSGFIPSCLPIS